MATPTSTPSPEPTPIPWVEPPLWGTCPETIQPQEIQFISVSPDGSRLYSLANQQIYRIEQGQATLVKNSKGQCLGFKPQLLEIDSKGQLFLAAQWEYEDKYQGARIYKAKPDLSEVTPIVDYNPKYIPQPQGSAPMGESSAYIADLTISSKDTGFLLWNESRGGNLYNTYKVVPFSETGLIGEPVQLINQSSQRTEIAFDDKSQRLFWFVEKNDQLESQEKNQIFQSYPIAPSMFNLGANMIKLDDFQVDPTTGHLIASEPRRVIRLNPNNQETTLISGNASERGFRDGKRNEALFASITSLDIDVTGNIYVADWGNSAIRKITPDGTVSTLYRAPAPPSPSDSP